MKKALGIVISATGALITYALFSIGETGNLRCYSMLPGIGGALLACIVVTAISFWILKNPIARVALSLFGSYGVYILILVIGSAITGDLAETMMWFPIILLFGIPNMLPLTVGTITGVAMFSGKKNNEAEQAA